MAEDIYSDQGRNFDSKLFVALCEWLGMEKTCTIPLHSQGDGFFESFNRTLAQQLAILTADHQQDWDTHLSFSWPTDLQYRTLCTPALLMLGHEL